MKTPLQNWISTCVLAMVLSGGPAVCSFAQTPVTTTITYQGRVRLNTALVTTATDFRFTLWSAATNGAQVAGPLTFDGGPGNGSPITPERGLFNVPLNFGINAFNGDARWLQVEVRNPSGAGNWVLVNPRQAITAAPYAVHALTGGEWTYDSGDIYYNSGNVGIGTSTPNAPLHVRVCGTGADRELFRIEALGANCVGGTAVMLTSDDVGFGATLNNQWGPLHLGARNGPGNVARTVTILQNGNVGIGIVNPQTKLDVIGQSRHANDANLSGSAGPVQVGRVDQPSKLLNIGYDAANFAYLQAINVGVNFGDIMLNPLGGRVGIGLGSSLPSYQLQLGLDSAGKPGGGSWTDSSDRRLKRDIQPLENSLNRLLSLRGVSFEWIDPAKQGNLTGTRIGMIAQEVEQVFPQWVGVDANGYKTLGFSGFEALTVEALRDLRTEKDEQIAELQQTIADQNKQMLQLADRLAAIEARLSQPNANANQP